MNKSFQLKLSKIKYDGESVGDDIRVEITVEGEKYTYSKQIPCGSIHIVDEEVAVIKSVGRVPIHIKVIEEDLIFDDVGEINGEISFDTTTQYPLSAEFIVHVREFRGFGAIGKATAIFTLVFEVSPVLDDSFLYIPLTEDGWLVFRDQESNNKVGLPSFLRIMADGISGGRMFIIPKESL